MKKIVLLASIVALTALMLAAAPALAAPVVCDKDNPGSENNPNCDNNNNNNNNNNDFVFCDFNDDGHDDGDNNCEFNVTNRDRDVFRNIASGNVAIEAPIDISQETDQDCDSGDVSQPVSVTGGGDNSIQTVGLQPTANTGCSQNATDVLQAAPIVAGFGGDTILNNEDNNVFDVFGRDFCDDHDCFNNDDNGDNGVDFNNRTVNRIGPDRNTINGADFGDVHVDSNSSIDQSPAMTVEGGGTINQTAIANATPKWVWTAQGWVLM